MSHVFGLVIEGLVAVLLLLTIGYCMMLNTRLKRLKSDEQSLKATIGELITATEIAERAIGGLKHAVRDVNENLGNEIASATELTELLRHQLSAGDRVLERLAQIASAASARSPQQQPVAVTMSPAKSLAAAAQAFAERKRIDGIAA